MSPQEEQKKRLEFLKKFNDAIADPKVFNSLSPAEQKRIRERLKRMFQQKPKGRNA